MNSLELEKDIDVGAEAIGSDGHKLGKVEYVVVRPSDMRITDIVISTGAILGRDVVVPMNEVRDVEDGKVNLYINKDDLDRFPDYIEVNYDQPPAAWVPPAGWGYSPGTVLFPAGDHLEGGYVRVNIPPGTLGIAEGMEVETADGHKVGSVDALDVDLVSERVKGFVVKRGLLLKHDVRFPIGDVQSVLPGTVILELNKEQVDEIDRNQREDDDEV